jgi:hypothetical protein
MNNQELFADLFAYRYMLLDAYGYIDSNDELREINEIEIIKKLKYKLIELGRDYNEINQLLYDFYNYYEINITLEEITNTRILLYFVNDIINNSNNINNINIITNILSNYLNRNIQEEEEIDNRLTEEEINRIPEIEIEEELEDTCSICFETIPINSKIYGLPCNHKFHKNCLNHHLINCNRRCPLCRNECLSNN